MKNGLSAIWGSLSAILQSKRALAILSGVVVVVTKAYGYTNVDEAIVQYYLAMVLGFVGMETVRPVSMKFSWMPGKRSFALNHRRACMKYVQAIGEKYRGSNRYEDAKTELRAKLGEHRTGFAITDVVFAALMQWAVSQLIKWMQDTILDKDKGDDE